MYTCDMTHKNRNTETNLFIKTTHYPVNPTQQMGIHANVWFFHNLLSHMKRGRCKTRMSRVVNAFNDSYHLNFMTT